MTVRDMIAAIGRRWYVVLVVIVCAGALTLVFAEDGGTYWTRTAVSFTLPQRSTLDAESGLQDASLIAFAGTVATEINEGERPPRYSTLDAPYYGAGVREGVLVALRDVGNQWGSVFPTATLEIQIVGRTHEWVQERQDAILSDVLEAARLQQEIAGTTAADRIEVKVEPLSTEIAFVAASRTSQIAAVLAMSLAALLVSGGAAVTVDRLVAAYRARSARPMPILVPRSEGLTE
ncbi:hypothetical protein FVP74_03350 [Microbacterium saccharophilum]|uniref:Polysaccharide chain length determinant N-terminal domain-containing protein n=1 Tax=Microbacterium saccharophilum TaxID=1213358 RepID=A0A5C8IAY4_9MICO|nr:MULTISPECIES: hypothetical protein [Microbacterium]TXK15444.1 hypothetical protein FVP74_03350 [Microbacterium saccharophilum]GEP47158.1 hypothetical protein MSA03_06660 [Microbacterium saccharophilum]SFI67804.1 hypothetical protein SAMN04487751_2594 [Microbacterium saccharophilum]